MLRNGLVVVMTFVLGSGLVQAQNLNVADDDGSGEVTVYGAAQSADGQFNTFKVEQASGDENPLGDPIVNPDEAENMPEQSLQKTKPLSEPQQLMGQQLSQGAIQESLPQNPCGKSTFSWILFLRTKKNWSRCGIICAKPRARVRFFSISTSLKSNSPSKLPRKFP